MQDLARQSAGAREARGFTLVELLVVLVIIILVSTVALPTVLPALRHRQVSEAGRILQGALVGARDKAIHDGQPSGLRLLPDPAFPVSWLPSGQVDPTTILAYNRAVPIGPAPEYTEGAVTVRPKAPYAAGITGGRPCLVLEQCPFDSTGAPLPPANWSWNARVGDKVQLGGAGPWYTVIGPMQAGPSVGNPEMFVNFGPPGTTSPLNPTGNAPVEFLLLVNGRDDNANGWADEGWDGVDNDGINGTDDLGEWEAEGWLGAAGAGMTNATYAIRRRPAPAADAREVALPTSMVVDATTWAAGIPERSRLPVNRFTGAVDILVNPDGTVAWSSPYGVPSSFGMGDAFYHFWLAERGDLAAPSGTASPLLPIQSRDSRGLKGHFSLLTLSTRSGQIVAVDNPKFDDPAVPANGTSYDPSLPYRAPQQGVR